MTSDDNRSSTDSPVEVEEPPRALQIIEMTEEKDGEDTLFKFNLNEESLEGILNKIPKGMKVAVVSVVGNFRTGKSFLLTFMLRFLRNRDCEGDTWQTAEGDSLTEGNANAEGTSPSHQSFEWRGGHERMTTGIWMYSEPFYHVAANGEKVAVLVVDTQGLFDNEASMLLTSCIFGLSTLMSSHQIYNVKERISEDHLQNLALFSEYGRMALANDASEEVEGEVRDGGCSAAAASSDALPPPPPASSAAASPPPAQPTSGSLSPSKSAAPAGKAFQRLEFLVRDWPEVELLEEGDEFMDTYIRKTVMEDKVSKDLRETREQIVSCFDNVSCFMLPHPGLKVTRKTYGGEISGANGLEPEFRQLLDRYMRRVFGSHLEPKRIHGRPLTAPELLEYIKTYVALFQDGRRFPEAKTVLQATAEANTRNASALALKKYTEEMDATVGPRVTRYLLAAEASSLHAACFAASLALFDDVATMGPKAHIADARDQLEADMKAAHEKYAAMNAGRNPMKGVEPYLVPLTVALLAWLGRVLASTVCGVDKVSVCANFHDLFSHVYVMCVGLLLITGASNFNVAYGYYKQLSPLLFGSAGSGAVPTTDNAPPKAASLSHHPTM